ncbi:MAG: ISAzo13 family transposase, partial [Thermoplasmataceae archaeon]
MKEERSDIKQRFDLLKPFLNEKQVRIWTAVESTVIGYGGISTVSRETGFSRNSIAAGCEEMKIPESVT